MSYPPSSPSAPPPGINPAILGGGESAPYPSGPGYPPHHGESAPYPSGPGYPYHGESAPYPSGAGYPSGAYPPGGYPQPMENYPPAGGYPQPIPMTHQPQPGAGYPPPGAMQPGADWMPVPTGVPVCPRGLEYLTMIDQLLVHQKVELLEAFLSFETKNKYTVKNSMGQKIYTAKEDTDCCTRNCCGNSRPFDIKIKDNAGMEVIHLNRDLRCTACCFPCCLQRLEVFSPPGQLIGAVVQEWSILTPKFRVENERGEAVFKIEGPCCTFSICGDVDFQVLSTNGIEVGKISKQWSGLLREAFTDADHFGITFPLDLDVKMKATLLGALFLIDYMFFEKEGNKESDMPGML